MLKFSGTLNLTEGEFMTKKNAKNDLLFILALIAGIASLSIFLFTYPSLYDEGFYATIPYRLANGDSLVQHEWHLSQFSSLFSYLPVHLWLAVKGSSEGIIVFLRCVYFIIHTAVTVVIYKFFRKYGSWAIAAAMIFFTQVSYRVLSISYHSMFVIFSLLFILCLYSLYQKNAKHLYVIAGFCFGCCCVCNPVYCQAYFLYLAVCALRKRRVSFFLKLHQWYISKTKKNIIHKDKKGKKKKKQEKTQPVFSPYSEKYDCFFSKNAIIYSFAGIFLIAVIAIIFFFVTGGTIPSVFRNIQNLILSSEYHFSSALKFKQFFSIFNKLSFNIPFLLPLFYIVLFSDNNRKTVSHRSSYLIASLVIATAYALNIIRLGEDRTVFLSLPLLIFSSVCYILTDNKNKDIFNCMWTPTLIAAFFQLLSSNTYFASIGFTLTLNNIAGVVFVRDFLYEIRTEEAPSHNSKSVKSVSYLSYVALCLQIVFHMFVFQYGQIPDEITVKADTGPYSGIIMTDEQYDSYSKSLSDLDVIKKYNTENDPVLIVSNQNWMYMYSEAPIATHTTWIQNLNTEALLKYYKENPEKTPRFIYIDPYSLINYNVLNDVKLMVENTFNYSKEELSNGTLLTIESTKTNP